MYLTVTLNSALDRVIFIDEFLPETVMRTPNQVTSVGGKGFDASVALQSLGQETVALGFVAGAVGKQLIQLLETYQIQHDLIQVDGETRIAHVIVEIKHRRHSHIMTGALKTSPHDHELLLARIKMHLPKADWLICGGSLPSGTPQDIFDQIIRTANSGRVPTLIDSSGPPLRLAAQARPSILKMNRAELKNAFGGETSSLDALHTTAQSLRNRLKVENLVITCGGDGILAITPTGTWHSAAPLQETVNAAGAGDAVSGALTWRLNQGENWGSALRWAAAAGAAVARTPGTADLAMADVKEILSHTVIQKLE